MTGILVALIGVVGIAVGAWITDVLHRKSEDRRHRREMLESMLTSLADVQHRSQELTTAATDHYDRALAIGGDLRRIRTLSRVFCPTVTEPTMVAIQQVYALNVSVLGWIREHQFGTPNYWSTINTEGLKRITEIGLLLQSIESGLIRELSTPGPLLFTNAFNWARRGVNGAVGWGRRLFDKGWSRIKN